MFRRFAMALLLSAAFVGTASAGHYYHYGHPAYVQTHVYSYTSPVYVPPVYVAPVVVHRPAYVVPAPVVVHRPAYVVPAPVYYPPVPTYYHPIQYGVYSHTVHWNYHCCY